MPTHADLLDLSPPVPTRKSVPIDNKSGEWQALSEGSIQIDRVLLGEETARNGRVEIAFAPDGAADPAEIHLVSNNGDEFRIRIVAFTGEVRVEEGPFE